MCTAVRLPAHCPMASFAQPAPWTYKLPSLFMRLVRSAACVQAGMCVDVVPIIVLLLPSTP